MPYIAEENELLDFIVKVRQTGAVKFTMGNFSVEFGPRDEAPPKAPSLPPAQKPDALDLAMSIAHAPKKDDDAS